MQIRVSQPDKTRLYAIDVLPPGSLDIVSTIAAEMGRPSLIVDTMAGYQLIQATLSDPRVP